ncbi:hypothetical protein GY45DRAFT_1338234, partial [Cubamyces sp. BRFM 1775]
MAQTAAALAASELSLPCGHIHTITISMQSNSGSEGWMEPGFVLQADGCEVAAAWSACFTTILRAQVSNLKLRGGNPQREAHLESTLHTTYALIYEFSGLYRDAETKLMFVYTFTVYCEHDRPVQLSSPFLSPANEPEDESLNGYPQASQDPPPMEYRGSGQHSQNILHPGLDEDLCSPTPDDHTHLRVIEDETNGSPPASPQYNNYTIHGPALPEDDPEQLYDNWGGELAGLNTSRSESPASDLSDTDASNSDSEDPSDWDTSWDGFYRPGGLGSTDEQVKTRSIRDEKTHALEAGRS